MTNPLSIRAIWLTCAALLFSSVGYATGSSLVYSTYVGDWYVYAVAVDPGGNAYLAGTVVSPAVFPSKFPPAVGAQKTFGGGNTDAFVAKVSADGGSFLWATYLGGSSDELATAIAVDPQGSVVVAGRTFSSDFPIKDGFQNSGPAFVTRLSSDGGRILYSTRFGGSGGELINAIAVDSAGAIFLVGESTSADFPAVNAFQTVRRGGTDAFAAKIDSSGALAYATLLGGDSFDEAYGVAVDRAGRAFVTGYTYSENLPVRNGPRAVFAGGNDGFLAVLSPDGAALLASTYFGGIGRDVGHGVAVRQAADGSESVLLVGSQDPPDAPKANGAKTLAPAHAPEGSLVYETLLRFTASPSSLSVTRSLDGGLPGVAIAAAATASGFAAAGQTDSAKLVARDPIQASLKGVQNLFLQDLDAAGDLRFSSYLGSSGRNVAAGLAVNGGDLFVAGSDDASDLLLKNGIGGYTGGNFLARISPGSDAPAPCVAGTAALCLKDGRFRVTVSWRVPSQNRSGSGQAVSLGSESGYFWFYSAGTIELAVKIVDGRAFNDRFWFFCGG
ncbi:MAG TPA: SBBP repeat-containing protein, partial [Thermoanaerobaculia bacterium]|nr:SBBP repeat-containing protein [Thermoanaerobaculia bacterium]